MGNPTETSGPDLKQGIAAADLAAGAMLVGHVDGETVLLARQGDDLFAVGASCTHYGGPLGEGLLVGDTVRCPWHHACFSLRTGEAVAAPALAPVACWQVERRAGQIFVQKKVEAAQPRPPVVNLRDHAVIIGGGAAGFAAAEMLRRESYGGEITMLSADDSPPYDRPNLSKDYLAGTAPEEWIPLRDKDFYEKNKIDLRLATTVTAIDVSGRTVTTDKGEPIAFTTLLIATGAEPIKLPVQGAGLPHVCTLRSLSDSREIIARAKTARSAVIVGASFIGLEAAAALRHRGIEVHVVAPEARPMERVFGPALGDYIRSLHEAHGVIFHLGRQVAEIDERSVRLDDGSHVDAGLVLVGIGVRPRLELAQKAGLAVDRGVLVNEYLETSAPGIFAAGDIANWPDAYSGERLRIEHWVVAERQGQTAARNILGRRERYARAPFFWTQQYDVAIDYAGHATSWDRIVQDGDIAANDVSLKFQKNDRTLAFASIFRGRASLEAELAMEQGRSP